MDQIREDRVRYRKQTLIDVVDAATAYHAETQRGDPAHPARFRQRERDLRGMIEYAYDAMHPGPITKHDVDVAELTMEIASPVKSKGAR